VWFDRWSNIAAERGFDRAGWMEIPSNDDTGIAAAEAQISARPAEMTAVQIP